MSKRKSKSGERKLPFKKAETSCRPWLNVGSHLCGPVGLIEGVRRSEQEIERARKAEKESGERETKTVLPQS